MNNIALHKAHQGTEGVGVSVNRLFPIAGKMNHDPFVLWDHFSIPASSGFPDHPHRGFEAITYVMQGSMQHTDNLGNTSTVTAGGMQRFTAGKGIVHSEMPSAEGETHGIQLWINLPHRLKQVLPEYQQVDSEAIPEVEIDGGTMRVLVGQGSPLKLLTPVHYLDVSLQAGKQFSYSVPQHFHGFIYVVEGQITGQGISAAQGDSLLYEQGGEVSVNVGTNSRFLLCFGEPHGEPIIQRGTFVD